MASEKLSSICVEPELVEAFSNRCGEAKAWIQNFRQLIEDSVQSEFSSIKFANYLDAERELHRRLPELRAICREARRLCQQEPRLSPMLATAVNELQSAWLTLEDRLAELKPERSLIVALSGDLKHLPDACRDQIKSTGTVAKEDYGICSSDNLKAKIKNLDTKIQQNGSQLQRMLNVTSTISRLLDVVCSSDLLHSHRSEDMLSSDYRAPTATGVKAKGYKRQPQQQETELSTSRSAITLQRPEVVCDFGSQAATASNASAKCTQPSDFELDNSQGPSEAIVQCDNSSNSSKTVGFGNRFRLWRATVRDSATSDQSNAPRFGCLRKVEAATDRPEALAVSASSASEQLQLLAMTEAALRDWQVELEALRLRAAQEGVDCEGGATLRTAQTEGLALLGNWAASLRDRCWLRSTELTFGCS